MTTISNVTMNLTSAAYTSVTLDVSYTVTFSPVERFLAGNGLAFEERVQVIGDDAGETTDVVLHSFPATPVPVTPGAGELTLTRQASLTVPRSSLNEDPGSTPTYPGGWTSTPNADELFARVEVSYVGLNTGPARADSAVKTITVV